MSTNSHKVSKHDFCHTKCMAIKDDYKNRSGNKILISNFGEFSEDLVDSILYLVETKLERAGERKGVIKRVFSIVVEGLQNTRLHGIKDEDGKQVSFIIISKEANNYLINIANLADNKIVDDLTSKLNALRRLNSKSLKKVYIETLSQGKISKKGGAGLGFITMAMKSDNNLSFNFDKIDNKFSLFNIQLKISAN